VGLHVARSMRTSSRRPSRSLPEEPPEPPDRAGPSLRPASLPFPPHLQKVAVMWSSRDTKCLWGGGGWEGGIEHGGRQVLSSRTAGGLQASGAAEQIRAPGLTL
jgi:hypothetical protein